MMKIERNLLKNLLHTYYTLILTSLKFKGGVDELMMIFGDWETEVPTSANSQGFALILFLNHYTLYYTLWKLIKLDEITTHFLIL